jgi:hypothetical protein
MEVEFQVQKKTSYRGVWFLAVTKVQRWHVTQCVVVFHCFCLWRVLHVFCPTYHVALPKGVVRQPKA